MASLHQAKKRLDLAERLDKNTPIERDVKTALQRVEACRSKLERADIAIIDGPHPPLAKLANDLDAWKSLNTSVRTRQRFVGRLIIETSPTRKWARLWS